MSGGPVDFYFELSSPYAYIASHLVEAMEQRIARPVRWRAMLLGPVMKLTGQPPLVEVPLKGDYARRDFARTAKLHGITYRHPARFPIGTVAGARAFYWVDQREPLLARKLAKALFSAYFVDGTDISAASTVVEIAVRLGIEANALSAALEDPALKEKTKAEVDGAIAAGVFGAPYFIVDGEPFWGVDRMPMLEEWVRRGGW